MAQFALGSVTPNSTTTGLPATQNAPALLNQAIKAAFNCQGLQFEALSSNTKSVFICDRATPDTTMNVYAEIPAPAAGPPQVIPAWTIGDPTQRVPFNAAEFFILPNVSGEGVRVTAIRSRTRFFGNGATVPGVFNSFLLMLTYWMSSWFKS